MKPLDHPLLADENIDPAVVAALATQGKDIRTVFDEGLVGRDDVDILQAAHRSGRTVLTHDSDFGFLAIQRGQPLIGVIFLRPGHIQSAVVLKMLSTVESLPIDVEPPFFIVVERRGDSVRVRTRAV